MKTLYGSKLNKYNRVYEKLRHKRSYVKEEDKPDCENVYGLCEKINKINFCKCDLTVKHSGYWELKKVFYNGKFVNINTIDYLESGFFESQLPIEGHRGTHPRKTLLEILTSNLRELLP